MKSVENKTSSFAEISFVLEVVPNLCLILSAFPDRSCFQTQFSDSVESLALEEPLLNVYAHLVLNHNEIALKSTTNNVVTSICCDIKGAVDQIGRCSSLSMSRNHCLFEDFL